MIKNLYLYLFSLLIIIFHLYFRISRINDEVSLEILKNNLTFFNYFMLFIVFFIQTINIFLIFKHIFKYEKKSKWTQYFINFINIIYWRPLEFLYEKVAPDLPGSGKFFVFIATIVDRGNINLRYKIYHHSYIFFSYFPQICVSSIFFVEVIFFHKIYYFFKLLFLLLIPLIFEIYIKLCISFYERNVPEFFEFLNIEGSEPDSYGNYRTWSFSFKSEYSGNSKELLHESISDYMLLNKIKTHAILIKKYKEKNYIYILLLTSFLYFFPTIYKFLYFVYL